MVGSSLLNKQALVQAMRRAGIPNQSQLIKQSGVHRNTLGFYLSGKRSPLALPLLRIARTLNVSPLSLLQTEKSADEDRAELISRLIPICQTYPQLACLLIGSRAKGKAARFSDWDLGLSCGARPLESKTYLALKDRILVAFDSWHFSVDAVNLDQAPDWFLSRIDYEPQFLAGNTESFGYFMGGLNAGKKH